MTDFPARFATLRRAAETALDRLLPPAATRPARLHEAMRYSLLAGGKRLRPVLVAAAAEAAGGPCDPWPAAVAVECVHTYSLIHDDLPAMDNSSLRRGRATCHVAFDERTAILAGDALQPLAFELLARHYAADPALAVDLVRELAQAAGSTHLVGGQMEDLLAERREATRDELRFIHLNKTAALLAACFALGARLGGAAPATIDRLREAGRHTGLAFQIVDDLLDATSDAATLGKTAGADAAAGKNTYVKLYGLAAAREEAHRHTRAALDRLDVPPLDTAFLAALVQDLEHRIR